MDQKYDSDVHWMLKLAANEDARLRQELEEVRRLANGFRENNKKLSIQIISLEEQLDNALQLANQLKDKIAKYESESKEIIATTRQEIVTQPSLFSFEEEKHKVRMQPTRRKLTTEQAQEAYYSHVNNGCSIAGIANYFGVEHSVIAGIVNGKSYKEIVRKD
jgi:hypothetical protein